MKALRLGTALLLALVVPAFVPSGSALAGDATPSPAAAACAAISASNEASGLPATFPDSGCNWVGRVIRDNGIGVTVPAAGLTAGAEALYVSGSQTLSVTHAADGTVTVRRAESPGVSPAIVLAACSDTADALEGFRVSGGYSYRYNPYSAPSNVNSTAAGAISAAFTNLAANFTDCAGITKHPAPAPHYLGTTTTFANIFTNYTCAAADGQNTVSWLGSPGPLALTCFVASGGFLVQSDLAINHGDSWFTGGVPAGCSNSYDLQGVVTHEAGHTYGLGHTPGDPVTHQNQTMNSTLSGCTTKYQTLGTGDLNGMIALY